MTTAVQKAARRPTKTDILAKSQKQIRDLYGLNRLRVAPPSTGTTVSLGGTPSAAGASGGVGNFLRTQGDTMIGPIAFFPVTVAIDGADAITIGQDSGTGNIPDYSTYVFVSGGATNDLESILGAGFSGQWLIIQTALTETITVEDFSNNASGNIVTPDGNNIILDGTTSAQTLQFIFDVTVAPNGNTGGWRVIAQPLSGTNNTPDGTAVNDHLEWDGAAWLAQQTFNFGAGTLGSSGFLKFANNAIILSARDAAGSNNVEFKVDGANFFDFFRTEDLQPVALRLRARDGGGEQIGLISQLGGGVGALQLTTPDFINLQIVATTRAQVLSTGISMLGNDIRVVDNIQFDGSPLGSAGRLRVANNDIVLSSRDAAGTQNLEFKINTGNFFEFSRTEDGQPVTIQLRATDAVDPDQLGTISQLSGSVGPLNISSPDFINLQIGGGGTQAQVLPGGMTMLNNDIIGLNALLFTDSSGQIAGAPTAPEMQFLLADTADEFRFTNNVTDSLKITGTAVTTAVNIAMGNNDLTGVNQIAFNEANQTITDGTAGMFFSLPDATDSFDFTIDTNLNLSIEKFFVNFKNSRLQVTEETVPSNAPTNEAFVFLSSVTGELSIIKDAGGAISLEGGGSSIPHPDGEGATHIIENTADDTKTLSYDLGDKSTGTNTTLHFPGSNSTVNFPNLSAPSLAVTNANNSFSVVQTFTLGAVMSNNLTMGNNTILGTDSIEFNASANNRITDNSGGLRISTAINDSITLEEIGIKVVEFDFDGAATFAANISIVGDFVIRPTVNVGGFFCQPNAAALGTAGSLLIPFDAGTPGTAAAADTDFGAIVGGVGFYGGGTAGVFVMRLANGNWVGFKTTDASTPVLTAVRLV